jgi:DNA invertase Pin-like site-specific DNA recombinase
VVSKLDRLGRSVRNLCDLSENLRERGIDLVATQQGIDTTTPAGKLLFHMLAAVAEFERDLIVERTNDGLRVAREQGRCGGRPAVVSQDILDLALAKRGRGQSVSKIAGELGIGRSTLYRSLSEAKHATCPLT